MMLCWPKEGASSSLMRVQEPEELFECISQCLLNACDRNAPSGWGALVHVM